MKAKLSEWQPVDLVDKEATEPLRSRTFNSRVASGDNRYYTLNNGSSSTFEPEDVDSDDELSDSEVHYVRPDAIDRENKDIFRNKQERKFIYLLAFSVVLITCLTVVLIWQHFAAKSLSEGQKCMTQECVKESAYILNKMETNIDPCTDFYQYACGKWEKNTPIPPSKSKYGSFSHLSDIIKDTVKEMLENKKNNIYKGVYSSAVNKTRDYYRMCMDDEAINSSGVDPLLKHIKELGSWTITSGTLSGTFDKSSWNIHTAIVKSHLLKHSPFFSMSVGTDEKNSSAYIIGFDQAGLTLNDQHEYFSNHSNFKDLKKACIGFMRDFCKLLGADESTLDDKVEELYKFEQDLAKIFIPREELVDPVKTYHKMTVDEFQKIVGDWLNIGDYLNDMFGKSIPKDEKVLVYTPAYFTRLNTLIAKTSTEVLANYIVWRSVEPLTGYLTPEFLAAALQLDKVESGIKEYSEKWKRCIGKVDSALGFAVGALYIQDHFADSSKAEVESLFEEIRSAFLDNLPSVVWMDEDTRNYAIEKVEAVTKMLGYPDYIQDPAKLDDYYVNLTLGTDLFTSKLAINRYYKQKNMKHLGTVPDRDEWKMIPTTVNGYYSPDFNHVAFPAGILQPPLFNPTSPRSFNFGSFGMIVGHELTHGFDNKGRNFDKFGNMKTWWTNDSSEAFDYHSKCFEEQYSAFKVGDTHLNGKTTLSENIADNGGMKVAFQAYKSWMKKARKDSFVLPGLDFTPNQLFFIGMSQLWCSHYTPEYAKVAVLIDVHSIAKFRVLGPMANSKYFANAFDCPVGSPMNPSEKCAIW